MFIKLKQSDVNDLQDKKKMAEKILKRFRFK